jgi:hypothetical protein
MNSKRESNYSVSDRTFDGAASMWLRKSAEEAPEVGTYNYDNVGEVEAYGGATQLDDFNSQWSTSLYGDQITSKEGKSEVAQVNTDTLLNDAWFCIMIDDQGKVQNIMERLRIAGVQYPADLTMKNMFGESTLWSRVNDTEFKLPSGKRESFIRMLWAYHRRDL